MANKNLFRSFAGKALPATDVSNHHRAPAYSLTPKHALAQYASTGCMNATYYASEGEQLDRVLGLAAEVPANFVARAAVYARERGAMKDVPALLCAVLSVRSPSLLASVFPRVIDDARMLRTFVQIIRSGVVGRKSLGTRPKKLILGWLAARDEETLFRQSIGQSPSMADVVKMVHPKPTTPARTALYGYLLGRSHDVSALPEVLRSFEDFKAKRTAAIPDVPFQMLTALDLGTAEWTAIARRASFQMTRMNLMTFARHGVFDVRGMADLVAKRLRDPAAIKRSRVLPYQLLAAYAMSELCVPQVVRDALHDAMEIAIANVPRIDGQVFVLPDVSGSMSSPITGRRAGATTKMRCIDIAALVAAAILRKNPSAKVIPFEQNVVDLRLSARDTVMTNAAILGRIGGGGTNCSAPLALMNRQKMTGDLVIYVSDNESWVDARGKARATETMMQWTLFKERNPSARLVCIDVQPNATTQATERADILNVGGFSDHVFEIIAAFANGTLEAGHWVQKIEEVQI